ncbi:PREDICTED: uncharacterized protein LOC109245074 [Nicotiana attenuata]|uniref:uncharacterized protein LOC109245074 n=1 Tax=Nicotiana attenuata TaxID=49451 RepID=UPI0009059A21|nr:PREDICTED: uncharacterized protein LOC109245074 [Nicotiana attenuata]
MESARASKAQQKYHSGYKTPHRVQPSKHDNPKRDFDSHECQGDDEYDPFRVVHELKVVPSTYYQLLKFPTAEGIKQIRGDHLAAREMNAISVSSSKGKAPVPRYFQVPEETDATKSTAEELEQVALFEKFLGRKFYLGTGLNPELRYPARSGRAQTKLGSQHFSGKTEKNILLPRLEENASKKRKAMEVYIDGRLVKSLNAGDHLKHLQETFDILKKHNIKLNPEKCAFRVSSGKFMGFLVSQREVKVNPDKINSIEDILDQLLSMKEVQSLTGRLSALSKFISRSSKKCH